MTQLLTPDLLELMGFEHETPATIEEGIIVNEDTFTEGGRRFG